MRRWTGILVLAASAQVGAGSHAHAEHYFSIFTGGSYTHDSDLHIKQRVAGTDAVFHGTHWLTNARDSPIYYGARIGGYSRKQPHWGLEVDLTHNKVYADTDRAVRVTGSWDGSPVDETAPMDRRVQRFDITHGVNILSLNVLYRWLGRPSRSFPYGRWQPFVGIGPSYYILHPENKIDGVGGHQEYEAGRVGWEALAGTRYGLAGRTSLFIETKYTSGKAVVLTADGWAETRLRTWHGIAGVEYGF